jgi:glycosyltransferase involved in cell wall biosynthesis
MSSAPTVSVIMPFLNLERYIEESIRSVVQQSRSDWELLLVDDGSRDASRSIAERFAEEDPRIRVLWHPDGGSRGASAARNLGVREARGRYVTFLDADDVWCNQKLADHLSILERTPDAVMLYANTRFWFSWTGDPGDRSRDHLPDLGVPVGELISGRDVLSLWLRGLAAPPCTCAAFIRREAVEAVGGWEESFRYVYTDQAFFSKIMLSGDVVVADGCLDWYRQHSASSVQVAARSGELAKAHERFLRWLLEHLAAAGESSSPLSRVIQNELHWLARPAWQRRLRRSLGTKLLRRGRRVVRSLRRAARGS